MRPLVLLIAFSILVLAFFLRVYFSFDAVFSFPIKYAADDGVYHMRIVENLLLGDHFPKRIYFDPYTNFPQGTFIHFGPLFDYLLAFIIWVLSLGNPSQEAINLIAPFYPPLLGVLAVLVVYFLGKVLWGDIVGLIAASLAALSPNLIFRSLLGATDHHVGEYLFSSLAVLSLILLLKFQEKQEHYSGKWWFLTILTGIALGLYFLVWEGALLFLFIFFIFLVGYFLLQYFSEKPWRHILFSGIVIFFIVLMMIIPFFGKPNLVLSPLYNILHLASIVFGLLFFLASFILADFFSRQSPIKKIWFLPSMVFIILLITGFIYFLFPEAFEILLKGWLGFNTSLLFYEKARELVLEMRPLRPEGMMMGFGGIFFFSLAGLVLVIYNFFKKRQGQDLLLIVWFLVVFVITGFFPFFGQVKYVYYLWVVISLLSSLFLWRAFTFAWQGLKIIQQEQAKKTPLFNHALAGSLLTILFLLIFLLYPFPFNIVSSYPRNLPLMIQSTLGIAKNPFRQHQDYYEAFQWLRENTPEPSLSYYSLYQEPRVDPLTNKIFAYNYPPDSYGILARWDLGHAIVYYAHRPVISNPFGQGIGRKENGEILQLGEGVFFTEIDERKAIEYLDQLKVRYIITDASYAHPEGYFKQIVKWIQGDLKGYTEKDITDQPSNFDNSMAARLHLLDGTATSTERKRNGNVLQFKIEPLRHFRLIYESPTVSTDLHKERENIKLIKIFEYVKGAKITGRTENGIKIFLSTEIETNQKRKFSYQQEFKTTNGYFEFIVPYSTFGTKGWLKEGTKFTVLASPYKLKIKDKEIEVEVSEQDILEGRTIKIDNLY